ncbi:hypothetical protein ACFFWB_26940 [Flavobacterium procerum]|uniref:hypothetical protein n=1 Tax=Flavobacterium procerum TaxID=1455569 RepID=UPI0035EAA33B
MGKQKIKLLGERVLNKTKLGKRGKTTYKKGLGGGEKTKTFKTPFFFWGFVLNPKKKKG